MIQRIVTAAVLIPLVLLLILRAPVWLLAVVAGAVALLAIREFLELTGHYAVEPFGSATYAFVGIFFAMVALIGSRAPEKFDLRSLDIGIVTLLFSALAPFVFLAVGMKRERLGSAYPAAGASVFAFAYVAVPMSMLVGMRLWPTGSFLLIFLMVVVWSGDILAYFVGKSMGRHKMSPRISPKKTWEGAAASLVASIVFGTVLYSYSLPISLWLNSHILGRGADLWDRPSPVMWKVVLLSALLNVAAQLGDLVESALKRGADIKDSGSILPGHGGMLDRIDAMLFAGPVLWFFVSFGRLP